MSRSRLVADEEAIKPLREVITLNELAALLRVDRKTVYAAAAHGEIPCVLMVTLKRGFLSDRAGK